MITEQEYIKAKNIVSEYEKQETLKEYKCLKTRITKEKEECFTKDVLYKLVKTYPICLLDNQGFYHDISGDWLKYFVEVKK